VFTIVVTGAAGVIGQRTVRALVDSDPGSTAGDGQSTQLVRVIALDQHEGLFEHERVEAHRTDLLVDDLGHHLVGADAVIHLAEEAGRPGDAGLAEHMLNRVLDGADAAQCRSLVLLSSATVYGAHPDNPVPITENQPARPIEALDFAVAKYRLEQQAQAWAEESGGSLAILRPATTLSEYGASWMATAMRAATTVRPDQVDPPVQFLHHDDLASALVRVATAGHDGVYNVAPDGWIGQELFDELVGGVQLRASSAISDRVLDLGRRLGIGRAPVGIEAYVRHPWVIANDRLRSTGWSAVHSNEEAYVAGTPAPPWAVSAQRRQELALAAAGLGVAGLTGIAAAVTRRLVR
jgi:nucleoside-diphosphate-sugar epimerase